MEDPQTNILVPIGYCNVGNLCAYIIAVEFAVCSLRQQAQDNLAQQFFWDGGPSSQASLCRCPLEMHWSMWAFGLALEHLPACRTAMPSCAASWTSYLMPLKCMMAEVNHCSITTVGAHSPSAQLCEEMPDGRRRARVWVESRKLHPHTGQANAGRHWGMHITSS